MALRSKQRRLRGGCDCAAMPPKSHDVKTRLEYSLKLISKSYTCQNLVALGDRF